MTPIINLITYIDYIVFLYYMNRLAFGNENNILDFDVLVGLLHIYIQFDAMIDIILWIYNIKGFLLFQK